MVPRDFFKGRAASQPGRPRTCLIVPRASPPAWKRGQPHRNQPQEKENLTPFPFLLCVLEVPHLTSPCLKSHITLATICVANPHGPRFKASNSTNNGIKPPTSSPLRGSKEIEMRLWPLESVRLIIGAHGDRPLFTDSRSDK